MKTIILGLLFIIIQSICSETIVLQNEKDEYTGCSDSRITSEFDSTNFSDTDLLHFEYKNLTPC